jgi:hypothetical protein
VTLHELEEDAGGKGGRYRRTEQICAAGGGKRKHCTTQTLSTRGDNNISTEEKKSHVLFPFLILIKDVKISIKCRHSYIYEGFGAVGHQDNRHFNKETLKPT